MSGFLLIAVIVDVLASIASIGIAILLLLDVNKELFKNIKEEVFSKNIVPVNNVMEKVYFKEVVEYYDNGCSCCEPMETTNYTLVDYPDNLPEDLHNKLIDSCMDTSEQYRCLVDTSYVFSDTRLEYYEYVDRCYNLFNYEQMEEVLKQDGVEVVFL